MLNKLYSTVKKIIKENIVYISVGLLLVVIFNIPLPYKIETYGDLINVENKVIVKDGYDSKGSFNLTYVSEIKGNVFTYLVAKLKRNWDLKQIDESSVKSENHMDKILLENSLDTAVYVAYKSLNKNINVIDTKVIVLYLDENSNTNLEIGDIIDKVNDNPVYSLEDYSNIVKNSKKGEMLKILTSDNEEKYAEIKEINEINSTLIYLICDYDYDVKDVTFKFNKGESGPSGGLMIALSIYDQLTDNDLTKGRIIAGTGTVNRDGNVGGISGIKYKLKGAVKNKADIFLVPKSNYSEAIKEIEENNYNIKLVSIEKFTDALKYLSEE